ncbi:MAG TPA: alpha/beta hydrolase [Puia sp.]|nr:alpha/beta hydrolase [Puia sp.]
MKLVFFSALLPLGLTAAQPDSTSGYATIGKLKMYYEIHGKNQRRHAVPAEGQSEAVSAEGQSQTVPLVLIHGGGSTIGTSFGHVLHAFAQHREVIAVELQAHGHTADIPRPLSFHQDADDIAALLQQLHIEKADFFGFSNGGQTAMDIGIRHPQLVRKLVIGSAFFKRSGAYDWFWPGFDNATLASMPQYLKDAYLDITHDSAGLERMFHRDVERMKNFRDWPDEEIKNVQAPTLLIIGDQDLVRPEYAVELSRMMPHARLFILPGHHGEYLESPGPLPLCTAAMIDEFLDAK